MYRNRLLSEHLPAIGQDFLIDNPLATPPPVIGQPIMTDSSLATPTLALQCDHPPITRTVVQAPPSVLVPQCEPTTPLLLHGVVSGAAGAYCGALSAAPLLLHGVVRGAAYCDAVFLPGEPSSRGDQ